MQESNPVKYYIGVDGGGTKTHAVLVNQGLEVIDNEYGGPANIKTDVEGAYNSISTVIDNLLKKHQLNINDITICVGVAGYSVLEKRQLIISKLEKHYPKVILNSDCHIACLAAHNNKDGAIIICGTGIVGYSICQGQMVQIGGWGFPHGDLGGGAWLGLEVARLLCMVIDGVIKWNNTLSVIYKSFFEEDQLKCKMWLINAKPSDYAQLAHFVFTQPRDEFASTLLKRGIDEVSQYIKVLQKNTQGQSIKLVGGLAKLYIDGLKEIYPDIELSKTAPALGAVYMCL